MCRVEFMVALSRAMGRPPTDEERAAFLSAMAELAGGEYLYVPKLPQSQVDAAEVWRLRNAGLTIRKIARQLGCSAKPVWRVLQQPELFPSSPY